MLTVKIIEGPRGVGKTTVARLLRNRIEGSTLINLTGFKADGEEGFKKIKRYYIALQGYLDALKKSGEDYTIIFDRTFFSEMVYSPLYKSYDFKEFYDHLCRELIENVDKLEIYFLTLYDREEMARRLVRDKVGLFDSVEESVDQSLSQQRGYKDLFDNFLESHDNSQFIFRTFNTADYTPDELKDIIIRGE